VARNVRSVSRSFAGGEMSPEMFGRIDDLKFQNGAAKLLNFIPKPQGPAFNRPGFQFVRETKRNAWAIASVDTALNEITTVLSHGLVTGDPITFSFLSGGTLPAPLVVITVFYAIRVGAAIISVATTRANALAGIEIDLTTIGSGSMHVNSRNKGNVRLFPFTFSVDQTMVIEMGRAIVDSRSIGYLRFHTNGATLLYATPPAYVPLMNISTTTIGAYTNGVDLAGNAVLLTAAHGLTTGDPVTLTYSGAGSLTTSPAGLLAAGVIVFAIVVDPDEVAFATTLANALAGTRIDITAQAGGAGERNVHFAYEIGDLTNFTGVGAGAFYCTARPWLTHTDHPPTSTDFWYRESSDLVYEVPHNYADEDVFNVHYVQSGDVLTLVHPRYPAAELKRLSATKWTLTPIIFDAAVAAPTGLVLTPFLGEGMKVTAVTAATPAILTTSTNHTLVEGEPVQITDVGTIVNGLYVVGATAATTLALKTIESGEHVGSGSTTVVAASRVRSVTLSADLQNTYAVTAIGTNNEESLAGSAAPVTINLFVAGAFVDLSWNTVVGATRYRVYKRQTGLFGFIGEVEAPIVGFRDDNIGPDLSLSPPIFDSTMTQRGSYTFNLTTDRVLRVGHGLLAGMPIVFSTTDVLPTGITVGVSYYVINPTADDFQLAATSGGVAINLSGSPAGTHTGTAGNFPAAVAYFEQRRCFAGPLVQSQDVWMTRSSTESNLTYSIPVKDSDRIYFRIAAREGSTIRHIVPVAHLVLLANSAEYRVTPINSDAITPGSISVRPQSYIGASNVQPAVVNNLIIFGAARGGHVREMGFSFQANSFVTGDLSLRAAHLFDGEDTVQLAYAKAPLPIVWFVSTSGLLLGITYVPEEQVGAWHQHNTAGLFKSCTVVSEAEEDRLYVLVERTTFGSKVRFVERMGLQEFVRIENGFFVDSGLTFDGTNLDLAQTITVTGGITWGFGETVTVTAAAPGIFTVGAPSPDIGDELELTSSAGTKHRLEILTVSSATVATARIESSLPADLRAVATAAWAWARGSFSGLDHLTGETVSILADGLVQAQQMIVAGSITLATPSVIVHAGLAYAADLQTLPLIMQVDGYGKGRTKAVDEAWVRVFESGNFKIGPDSNNLVDAILPVPTTLQTTEVQTQLLQRWSEDGQVLIRQSNPLPLTVVGLTLEVATGG